MARAELATLPDEDVGRLRASYVAEVGLLTRTCLLYTSRCV